VKSNLDPKPRSGKQKLCETILAGANRF